ncbi:MAG: glucosamine-6-phosphate deaminase [Clostridia bacterium]|nr:glucosamine-6-phosphate deaminase [Clostridia bacterium]
MRIIVDTPEALAGYAAERYVTLLDKKPDAVIGLATGSTPLGLYGQLKKLCAERKISFRKATSFNLDEYVGLDGTHDQSYRYFMDRNLFSGIDIDPQKTFVPSGLGDIDANAEKYEEMIGMAGGIDLQLLGLGQNGHIGFNEPGTPLESLTHKIELTQNTREANARFFASIDEVPTHAISMGIKTVMNARSVILIALGENKADAVAKSVKGPIDLTVPAAVLQLHPDVTFYLDEAAASKL